MTTRAKRRRPYGTGLVIPRPAVTLALTPYAAAILEACCEYDAWWEAQRSAPTTRGGRKAKLVHVPHGGAR